MEGMGHHVFSLTSHQREREREREKEPGEREQKRGRERVLVSTSHPSASGLASGGTAHK